MSGVVDATALVAILREDECPAEVLVELRVFESEAREESLELRVVVREELADVEEVHVAEVLESQENLPGEVKVRTPVLQVADEVLRTLSKGRSRWSDGR